MKIDGNRIYLRPLTKDDLELCVRWTQDIDVVKHVIQETKTREQQVEWIEETLANPNDHVFVITIKENNKAIGNCGIHEIANDERLRDERGISIGILIGEKDEWGKGYGAETISLLAEYAQKTYKTGRVWLTVDTLHERAIKAYQKAGFSVVREMDAPERIYSNGKQYLMEKILYK